MDLEKLGYTDKWVDRGFLTEETLNKQLKEFGNGKKLGAEHFRYQSFQNWLQSKQSLTNKEVAQYIKLANIDPDKSMAGMAVKDLFTAAILTEEQFEIISHKLPAFGAWTRKLIIREVLERRLKKEELSEELFRQCFEYKKEFKDNRLLMRIIELSNNKEILALFETSGSGKQLRKLAQKKVDQLSRKK